MLDEREGLFANAGFGNLESVGLAFAAAHKLFFFFASDSLEKSPGAFQYNEKTYQLYQCADADRKCKLFPCVDDVLNSPPNAMGVLVVSLAKRSRDAVTEPPSKDETFF